MIDNKKLSLRLGLLLGVTSVALFASTAGSLAWYAYSRSVKFSFVGTTVTKSTLLNIGIVDELNLFTDDDLLEFELNRETDGDKTICFSKSKSGLSLKAIQKYLFNYNYAVSQLSPVTTKARALDDQSQLDLYKSPEFSETQLLTPAKTNDYAKIPFAFKIINEDAEYVEGKSVWLTEVVCKAEYNIEKSIRVFVEGTTQNFLFRPADENTGTGETKVGGLLDLDGDGKYDYNRATYEEYLYGDFSQSPSLITTPYPDDEEHDKLEDINGTNADEASTFLAKHQPGSTYYDSFETTPPDVAQYYKWGQVKPSIGANAQYYVGDTGIPLCTTTNGHKIGYATFTIFVEGWDHSVIDKAAGYSFNLGLKFEIDRN